MTSLPGNHLRVSILGLKRSKGIYFISRNVGIENIDILVVGNKTDLAAKRAVPEKEGFQFAV